MARFICAFVLSMVSVAALGAETIELGPSDWRKWDPRTSNHSLEGLRTSYGRPVRIGSGTLNVNRNPVIPYSSIGNGLKGLARLTPGAIVSSAAMSALFLGMDWVFSEAEWKKMGETELLDPEFGLWTSTDGLHSGPSAESTCQLALAAIGETYSAVYVDAPPSTGASCQAIRPGGFKFYPVSLTRNMNCPPDSVLDLRTGACKFGGLVPLTDSDFDDLTAQLPSFSPGTVGGAAGDLQTRQGAPLPGFSDTDITGPSSVTGPSTTTTSTGPSGTETAISTTTTNISYGPTTITTTNTTTTNTYTNGEPSGTTTTTETPSPDLVTEPAPTPGSTSLDIPTDCEFMPTVCAFLDWFKEPMPMPEPDLPVVVDRDFERDYEMNLTAECPPPYTVETRLFGSLSISWQPFCDLATLIKPLVVGSAFLLSAFITLGIGRGKG